jgi:hypothetical protein
MSLAWHLFGRLQRFGEMDRSTGLTPGTGQMGTRPLLLALGLGQFARERASADDSFHPIRDPRTQFAVGGDDPDGRCELPNVGGDPVVRRFGTLPNDDHLVIVSASPFTTALLELLARDVRPDRTANVLGVDEHRCHGL